MKKAKAPTRYQLISLIEMGNLKFDVDTFQQAILDKYGARTPVFENLGFYNVKYKFPEKKSNDKYSLWLEIGMYPQKHYFVIGQSGLFLKIDENLSYAEVANVISESKQLIEFCKLFLAKPFGIVHFSDGDFYITNNGQCRYYHSYSNRYRDITEFF